MARLGAMGLDVDVPTANNDPKIRSLDLVCPGFNCPARRSRAISASRLMDLMRSTTQSRSGSLACQGSGRLCSSHSVIAAIGGLLGLKNGDAIPDFPITQISTQGVHAIATWLHGLITTTASRNDWIGYIASLWAAHGLAIASRLIWVAGHT